MNATNNARKPLAATELLAQTGWEIPVPLSGPPPAPPFPIEVFPTWLRDMVAGVARFTQTDPTMAATVALSVLSACVGGRLEVEARPGWKEPVNLFLGVVAEPGERKSPVHSAFTRPLYTAEQTLATQVTPLLSKQAALREIAERTAEKAKQDAARADKNKREELTAEAVSAALSVEAIDVPALPRLITDDATPEALTSLLAAHGGRMAVISDEGGIFDTLAGRYSTAPNLDPYLKGHAGTPMRIDRRGREAEHIDHPALTVGVMLQPSVLRKFGGNGDLAGKGMVARFLFTLPVSLAGWRDTDPDPVSEEVTTTYAQRIHDLALFAADSDGICVVGLTEEARAVRSAQAAAIEVQLRPGGALHPMREWGNKLAGATLRLAGLLHIAHHPGAGWTQPIDAEVMTHAVRLAEFFVEHYSAALHTITTDPENTTTAHVLGVLIDKNMQRFTRRELQRRVPRQLPKVAQVVAVLDTLTQLGWVRSLPDGSYQLHPRAAHLRERVDTLTTALEAGFTAGHHHNDSVNTGVDTPLTPLTPLPRTVNAVNTLSTATLTAETVA